MRRLNDERASPHPIAYAVIHAFTKNTANADCWYPAPAAPHCPCMDERGEGSRGSRLDRADRPVIASARTCPASLPDDADYGEAKQFCLPERLYLGDDAVKLRAVRAYASQLGRLARNGSHPAALDGIIDCNGYLTSFVRRTETFVLEERHR